MLSIFSSAGFSLRHQLQGAKCPMRRKRWRRRIAVVPCSAGILPALLTSVAQALLFTLRSEGPVRICHAASFRSWHPLDIALDERNHFTAVAYSTQPSSKASPNATRQAYRAARDSQADVPASKSARDDAPRAKTCKQTWSRQPATFAPNSHAKISQPTDSDPPKEHPSTSANIARRFSDEQPQPASSCTGQDQAAPDTSNAAPNS
jgi:hypothetical protein